MEPSKLTVRLLEKIATMLGEIVWDTEASGLYVEVGAKGTVRFKYKTSVRRGPKTGTARKAEAFKRTIGTFPEMSLDDARKEATRLRGLAREGQDPREGTVRAQGMWTVRRLYEEFLKARDLEAKMAPSTRHDYVRRFNAYLDKDITFGDMVDGVELEKSQPAWGRLPLVSITPEFAAERHVAIVRNHGAVVANNTLQNFRTTYNWALKKRSHLRLPANPVGGVTFVYTPQRTDSLEFPALPDWVHRLGRVENPIRRLFHLLCLFCGGRPGALSQAQRSWLRLEARAFIIPKAHNRKGKTGIGREVHIPLSSYLVKIFERLLGILDSMFPGEPWLFPTRSGKLRDGKVIPLATWREDDMAYGYILRHYYSNLCQEAGVQSTNRMLLMAEKIPGIEGTYLNQPFLFKTLLGEQEKVTAHILRKAKLPKDTVNV